MADLEERALAPAAEVEMRWAHKLLDCPACGSAIVAQMTGTVKAGTPVVQLDGPDVVQVRTTAELDRCNVRHSCSGRVRAQDDGDDRG